jgi:6-pyruvoyltetrahydropterin/6-carboxytetrahydropterin synthase
MPFRIAKTFTIETGHLLTKHSGACRFPHGHSRTIEVVVWADSLDEREMVCDFSALKTLATEAVARYDHAFALNSADPRFAEMQAAYGKHVISFPEIDPTTEVLARAIFLEVRARLATCASLRHGVRLERVRVTETGTSWAEYWE